MDLYSIKDIFNDVFTVYLQEFKILEFAEKGVQIYMHKKNQSAIQEIMRHIYRKKLWNRGVTTIAAVIVFVTTYLLILPAITMTKDTVCGKEEHLHSDQCYQTAYRRVLDCPYGHREDGVIILHYHDENCFDETGALVCLLPEKEGHFHTEECYGGDEGGDSTPAEDGSGTGNGSAFTADGFNMENGSAFTPDSLENGSAFAADGLFSSVPNDLFSSELTAVPGYGKTELTEHIHTEDCYDAYGALICGKPEVIAHQHDEECFRFEPDQRILVCGMEEHVHDDSCYVKQEDMIEEAGNGEEDLFTDLSTGETALQDEIVMFEEADAGWDTENQTESFENPAADAAKDPDGVLFASEPVKKPEDYQTAETEHIFQSDFGEPWILPLEITDETIDESTTEENDLAQELDLYVEKNTTEPITERTTEEETQKKDSEEDRSAFTAGEINNEESTEWTMPEVITEWSTEWMTAGSVTEETTEWITSESVTEETTEWTTSESVTEETTERTTSESVTEETTEWTTSEYITEGTTEWTTSETGTVQTTESTEQTTAVLEYEGKDYQIRLIYSSSSGIPDGAKAEAKEIDHSSEEYQSYLAQAKTALGLDDSTELPKEYARFFDIRILAENEDGEWSEIEPAGSVRVEIIYKEPVSVEGEDAISANIIHFDEKEEETKVEILPTVDAVSNDDRGNSIEEGIHKTDTRMMAVSSQLEVGSEETEGTAESEETNIDEAADADPDHTEYQKLSLKENLISFDVERFSVYGVIYTVDFHWKVNGKIYDFSIPGGGFVSLEHLVEMLGIIDETEEAENDADSEDIFSDEVIRDDTTQALSDVQLHETVKKFVADIMKVELSTPGLLSVNKAEADTTVREIKDTLGLEIKYSEELTEEEIQAIDDTVVEVGDWALISTQPFESEEEMTVTLKDGEILTIRLTDAQITRKYIAASGAAYIITVIYDETAKIPDGAELAVGELTEGTSAYGKSYEDYVTSTENVLGMEAGSSQYIRLFEISIVKDEEKIQPAAGSKVEVRIELADSSSDSLNVVHFSEGSEEGEEIQSSTETGENGAVVEFRTDSFSVYSIVDAPEPVHFGPYKLSSVDEIEKNTTYLLSYASPEKYFTAGVNSKGCLIETSDSSAAAEWYFEKVGENGSTFYIYTLVGGVKKYIHQKRTNNNEIELAESGTAFALSETGTTNTFFFKHNSEERYLQHSNGGGGIRFYTDKNDKTNPKIYITNVASAESQGDPYDLDGKSFGIAYNDNSVMAAAMSANSKTVNNQNRFESVDMLIRPDVLNNKGSLLVAENSDIQEWTFEFIEEDKYYIKSTVDGTEKYLCISNGNVTLADDQAAASQIQATPGTGVNSGKWHFSVNNYSLNFTGSTANGFNAAYYTNATTWLNLVEKSTLTDDDFVYYSARKISASDEILSATEKDENGDIRRDDEGNPVYRTDKIKVVVYTRVWNSETSKYEFYAVDHDGSLVRVYDSGDQINWVGNQVNSTLWEFTEYTNSDGTPSSYYELENTAYSNTFLAPQSNGIIANHTVGINMEGRQEGFDYTNILAWDESAYAYSGLKVEGNRIVPCPKDEADDFYFAVIVPPVLEADPPTTVETVDNNEYGISMRMIDFNNQIMDNRDSVQHPFFGGHAYNQTVPDQGLLSTDLINGYPFTTAKTGNAGISLSNLFTDMTTANHLFIQSVYNESGYLEYDSTQNFASLNENGDFTVYNQLGAIGTNTGVTRTHGQFMPYNNISAEKGYAYDTSGSLITNKTDVLRNELPDSDPRKGEPLYSIPDAEADYFFGMELSASFTQTPNGLDNWGHDIIFEFTGDDDFWLYVDGELVLDLGGIHSAMPGSVNFRTGEVVINNTKTSLYDIFQRNYRERGMSETAVAQKLNEIFEEKEVDGKTVRVFSDYSKHTMKMFYMERGAGASNLKMRFNLASVQPGTVELSKKLTGTKNTSNKLIQYPYQVWYRMPVYRTENDSVVHDEFGNPIIDDYGEPIQMVQGMTSSAAVGVVFKGSKKLVPFRSSLNIGGTDYQNVFLLKAGETAVIKLPDQNCIYEIIECGVDTEVYEQVLMNGEEITGTLYNNTDSGSEEDTTNRRKDFGIDYETTGNRPRTEYRNKVAPGVMRTLSFEKVVYDTDGTPMTPEQTANVSAKFSFRLYLDNEFADQNNLSPANMYHYYVKAPDGSYCRWNSEAQRFDPLDITYFEGSGGLEEYLNGASSTEKSTVVFTTSMNGSITNIPAGYTVEVRDLIVGTKYKIDEPDRELPKGYTRRDADGYVRTDLAGGSVVYYTDEGTYGRHPEADNTITAEPVSDTIVDKTESPNIEIRNQDGWGLTAEKEWTDKDFIIHDPIYLAVYLADGDGSPEELIDGTVRRLNSNGTEIYWFFPDLKVNDEPYNFNQFIVREVELTDTPDSPIVVDEKGVVTGYSSITPSAEGGSISVGGKTAGGNKRTENYTVNYQPGESTGQNENIRTDTVTNSRPGIQIYKTDWNGENYLSGAEFTLKDSEGHDVGHASYTSDSKGLVTTAYLNEGTFTLDEIKMPAGYVALDEPITITVTTTEPSRYDLTVTAGSTIYYITLSGPTDFFTAAPATDKTMARITVKNRTVQELRVLKEGIDDGTKRPLCGVHFALYEQVKDSDGNVRPAYNPKNGYEDLVTDENGILGEITMSLGSGTYYLREKEALSGYKNLAEDLCFTIGEDGTVAIHNSGYSNWLTRDASVPGTVSYQISIENTPLGITVRKTDETDKPLPGSKFVLSKKNDTGSFVNVTEHGLGEEGLIDLTDKTEMTITGMSNGLYKLSETIAPSGYIILIKDIYFEVSDGAVTLTDKDGGAETYSDVVLKDDNSTIEVKNVPGIPLPSTGGKGTRFFCLYGIMLTALAGVGLMMKQRRKDAAYEGRKR